MLHFPLTYMWYHIYFLCYGRNESSKCTYISKVHVHCNAQLNAYPEQLAAPLIFYFNSYVIFCPYCYTSWSQASARGRRHWCSHCCLGVCFAVHLRQKTNYAIYHEVTERSTRPCWTQCAKGNAHSGNIGQVWYSVTPAVGYCVCVCRCAVGAETRHRSQTVPCPENPLWASFAVSRWWPTEAPCTVWSEEHT